MSSIKRKREEKNEGVDVETLDELWKRISNNRAELLKIKDKSFVEIINDSFTHILNKEKATRSHQI